MQDGVCHPFHVSAAPEQVWFLPCGWGARSWFKGELHNLVEDSVRILSP